MLRFLILLSLLPLASPSGAPLTCNSIIKLTHTATSFHLSSAEINWGSGSGQQSVTATSNPSSSESMWIISEADDSTAACPAGRPVECNSKVRLTHLLTGKNLHSHNFRSPLTNQQEVSAFGTDGVGDSSDDWKIVCSSGTHWSVDVPFHLQHVETKQFLTSDQGARFTQQNCPNCPIVGQLEVVGTRGGGEGGKWVVQRGVFIQEQDED
ncbi:hypothetical protein TrVE_jg1870 [Triparma verrucosa]|uniref:MIR domain-containing protein n=1 Tax=Triparma verrucosa TaxID=1606542 RepID=A0A9W7F6U9_9STRA|nr:hypothetical protein TrVE_jg1870 [Triparma verrucosa]